MIVQIGRGPKTAVSCRRPQHNTLVTTECLTNYSIEATVSQSMADKQQATSCRPLPLLKTQRMARVTAEDVNPLPRNLTLSG
ncbi:hypothetical protein J6590_005743 [Homalodisca vitripennis]|nr:hypothetical protein J6590_005743 [Homalodisca vitripennis]